jgi:hypothetical protein
MPQPDAPDPVRGDQDAVFAQCVGSPQLSIGGVLLTGSDYRSFNLGRHMILKVGLSPRFLLESWHLPINVGLLDIIEVLT